MKGEWASAARESLILLEETVKGKCSRHDLKGKDLMAKAFSFQYDQKTEQLLKEPLIRMNSLKSSSERNEQEGIMYLSMGLMVGARNILAHSLKANDKFRAGTALQIINAVGFILGEIA